jgi:hypothetical protein
MSTVQSKNFKIEGRWCMEPNTKKVIRGALYTAAMGIVTLVVIVEGATELNVAIGIFYILGALLVFGVDIQKIEMGPVVIRFETDDPRRDRELDEFE